MKRAMGMKSVVGELHRPAVEPVHLGEAGDRDDVDQDGVAVGLGGGRELGAHRAGGAGLGLDDDGLLEERLHHAGERPRHHVGGAARRKRIDEGDGAGGIGLLRRRRPGAESGCSRGGADDELASVHHVLPGVHREGESGMLGALV